MDRNTVLIALGFAALAALFVSIGFRGQERHLAAQSERSLNVPDAPEGEGLTAWLSGSPSLEDRRALLLLCSAVALGSWLWILVAAFREHIAWGLAVLFGNWLGAVLFTVLGSGASLLPLFVMTSAYGLAFLIVRL